MKIVSEYNYGDGSIQNETKTDINADDNKYVIHIYNPYVHINENPTCLNIILSCYFL